MASERRAEEKKGRARGKSAGEDSRKVRKKRQTQTNQCTNELEAMENIANKDRKTKH